MYAACFCFLLVHRHDVELVPPRGARHSRAPPDHPAVLGGLDEQDYVVWAATVALCPGELGRGLWRWTPSAWLSLQPLPFAGQTSNT